MSGWELGLPRYVKPDVWLDMNHCLEFTTHQGASGPTGALFCHRKPDGSWCIGGFQWAAPDGPNWQLVSMQPFHVEPSIHCLSCGEHGFIRDGKWQPV